MKWLIPLGVLLVVPAFFVLVWLRSRANAKKRARVSEGASVDKDNEGRSTGHPGDRRTD
jgi:hypothetical protein